MNDAFHDSLDMHQIKHDMRQYLMPHFSSLPSYYDIEKYFSMTSESPANVQHISFGFLSSLVACIISQHLIHLLLASTVQPEGSICATPVSHQTVYDFHSFSQPVICSHNLHLLLFCPMRRVGFLHLQLFLLRGQSLRKWLLSCAFCKVVPDNLRKARPYIWENSTKEYGRSSNTVCFATKLKAEDQLVGIGLSDNYSGGRRCRSNWVHCGFWKKTTCLKSLLSKGVMPINTNLEQTFVCVFGCLPRGISVQHSPQFLVTRISYRGAGICPILEKLSRLDYIAT